MERPSGAGGRAADPPASGMGGSGGSPGRGGTGAGAGSAPTNAGGSDVDPPGETSDAGDSGGAAGSGVTPPPQAVPIVFNQCQAFEACGGNLEGTWTYTSACVTRQQLLGNECTVASVQLDGDVEGSLSFAAGEVSRSGSASGGGQLLFPQPCGVVENACSPVETLLDADDDACEQQNIECVCTFPIVGGEWDSEYEAEGTELTLGNGRNFEYCVNEDTLSYREITDELGAAGVYVLTRQ